MESEECRRIIYEVVIERFQQVSTDKNGFLVVNKCLNMSQSEQWRLNLIHSTITNIQKLINDEQGNFVIQTVLEIYGINNKHAVRVHEIYELYEYIIKNISTLFKQKFSSRVVDKAVDTMPREYLEKVCTAII